MGNHLEMDCHRPTKGGQLPVGQELLLYVFRCYMNKLYPNPSLGQRWQLHLTLSKPLYRGHGNGGVLGTLTGSAYIVW
jgi:hypothetical protein